MQKEKTGHNLALGAETAIPLFATNEREV